MKNDSGNMWQQAGSLGAVGLEMGLAVGLGYILGDWLDNVFGTSPYLTIFWVLAGIGAAFKALIVSVRRTQKRLDAPDDKNSGDDGSC